MDPEKTLDIKMGLSRLTKREREIILLYFFEDMNEKEISRLFSISQQRVNMLKNRALLKLRKFLH